MTFDELLNLVSSRNGRGRVRVCADSRQVKKGDVFVAIKGTIHDGHDFIAEALKNGARYIVCNRASSIETITVEDSAKALAVLAQGSWGNPSKKLVNLAVTGTNGKTTVAFLVRSVIRQAGDKCGLVGTILYDTGAANMQAGMTTPDALGVAKLSAEMVTSGAKYMMIEASSHALAQKRLAGIGFKAAAFTNLSGDHLDYHKDMQNYLAAKMSLFQQLSGDAVAVLNKQSPEAEQIAKATKADKLWYAIGSAADITAHIKSTSITGTTFQLQYAGRRKTVRTALLGRYNISNHLAAAGLCVAAGFDFQTIAAGLAVIDAVPGRLEPVNCGQDFSVLIDYAHTDDALKNVLATLRSLCKAKLIVVFGCGGDRDRSKRPRMAKVAERLADLVVVTSDNPRSERPEAIINDIAAGFERPDAAKIKFEPDRKEAIRFALSTASKNDVVLIAGKGHETYQIIGKQKFDFSDKKVAREFLKKQIGNREVGADGHST